MIPVIDRLAILLMVAILGTMWFLGSRAAPSPLINGTVAVPSQTHLMFLKTSKDADAVTVVSHYGDTHQLHLLRRHFGAERASPDDLNATDAQGHKIWSIEDTEYTALVDPGLDVGGFVGYARWSHGSDSHHQSFQSGIRISPVRTFWGVASPDFLLSDEAAGLGISFTVPDTYAGDIWSHAGIGVGRLYGFHGDQANLAYLSFSFRY